MKPLLGARRGLAIDAVAVYNVSKDADVWVSRRDNSRGHHNVHSQPVGSGFGFLSFPAGRLRQERRSAAASRGRTPAAPAVDTDAEKVVNVYNWSDYIDPAVLEDFTKETGVKVDYEVMDSNELLETKLVAGRTGYDVVVPSASFLARQIKAGIYQKLDKSKLPNLKNLDPEITKRLEVFDPGNEYAVNYMWGTSGVAYNEEAIKAAMPDAPVDSFAMFWDPKVVSKFAKCGVSVLDAPSEVIGTVLIYLGKDANSENPEDLKAAEKVLMSVRPYIRNIHSSRLHRAAGGRRNLPRARLVGRRAAGQGPCRGSAEALHHQVQHPEGRRRHVLRQHGDSRRRRAREERAPVHRLHAACRSGREEQQLHQLRQQQRRLVAAGRARR